MVITRPIIKFYLTECGKIIRNSSSNEGTYLYMNNVGGDKNAFTQDEFSLLKSKQIKRDEYSRLMNEYFRNVEVEWEYNGRKYRKLPNFNASLYRISDNYNIGKDVPLHGEKEFSFLKYDKCVIVYHWGKVYLHTISYGGYPQGQLIDIKTGKYLQWTKLKNCAPILDIAKNKII